MDICHEADPKESPEEGTKSNEDSGVETMEIDDSGTATPTVERKEAEKRKRTSSRLVKNLYVLHKFTIHISRLLFHFPAAHGKIANEAIYIYFFKILGS